MNLRHTFFIVILIIFYQFVHGQKNVSITIDDVPNTYQFEKDHYNPVLLNKLDALNIPVAIFINEGLIYKTDSISKNFGLLNNWSFKKYITLGNHSFAHLRYSEVGIDSFKIDILNGESISKELSKKYNKTLRYFRFPYNDMGQDSLQHVLVNKFLTRMSYQVAPFTIESSDWMFNYLYEYYLDQNNYAEANKIGRRYLSKTLAYFDFYDDHSIRTYGRSINQIYLCHDNKLNSDYLPLLVEELKKKDYRFISLEKAMMDKVYNQNDNYFKKWGVSWLYRWMNTQKERIKIMKQEPNMKKTIELYEKIVAENRSEE